LGDVQLQEFEVRARVKMEGVFKRKYEINSFGKSLTLCQKAVGDVSCVIWDAALVLAKYLKPDVGTCKIGFEVDQL
jgi:hypothetical protein